MRNTIRCVLWVIWVAASASEVCAQYYQGYPGSDYHPYWGGHAGTYQQGPQGWQQPGTAYDTNGRGMPNVQYDYRDAETILRDQVARTQGQYHGAPAAEAPEAGGGNYYGHRIQEEGRLGRVMAEAGQISNIIKKRNGKAFVVIDKRNYQFYLYDRDGRVLRIGPVAVGKGRTNVGAFETPIGVFPIKRKVPVDDWIRPDWYFIEEGEPIPSRWEDRRVPGFFRYKLVFEGTRYIHYAEATGGRLTHGCLGLDWEDAEAVFHTLDVGSYCIIIDGPFLARLARGEFPIAAQPAAQTAARKPSDDRSTLSVKDDSGRNGSAADTGSAAAQERVFRNLW